MPQFKKKKKKTKKLSPYVLPFFTDFQLLMLHDNIVKNFRKLKQDVCMKPAFNLLALLHNWKLVLALLCEIKNVFL